MGGPAEDRSPDTTSTRPAVPHGSAAQQATRAAQAPGGASDANAPAVSAASANANGRADAGPGSDKAAAKAASRAVGQGGDAEGEQKLSAKELKLKKQAEKQARRAQEKAARGDAGEPAGSSSSQPGQQPGGKGGAKGKQSTEGQARAGPVQAVQGQTQTQAQQRRTGSMSGAQRPLAPRRRGSQTVQKEKPKEKPKPGREVGLFGHLYGAPRRTTLDGVSREVHPAVLSLGFQMSNYTICGSNARCVAMLLAFKAAIASYTTPPTTSLARHLTSHYLSPQIDYLKSHRPISVSMGNAIRWLKDFIIHIDPDTPEPVAKADISEAIDTFIRERITVADQAIADSAKTKIRPGSRVVTYAKSSIVEQTLLAAARDLGSVEGGSSFSVTVLDSRPLFEGRNLVRALVAAGIDATYALLPAASHVLPGADLCLLGAHAMMANGRLYSRVGTACVAMLAKGADVPVIVLAESVKFTDRVALDSIVLNEVAPGEELVVREPLPVFGSAAEEAGTAATPASGGGGGGGGKGKKGQSGGGPSASGKENDAPDDGGDDQPGLVGWEDRRGLQLLNILHDVTPAEYIDMVITEYGSLPPSSVPVVYRISAEKDVRG